MPDQVMTELPRWLVRHICRSENHKLMGKMPDRWYANQQSSRPSWMMGPSHYQGHDQHVRKVTDYAARSGDALRVLDQVTHLDTNDYRLWAEVRSPATTSGTKLIQARCRWCHTRFNLQAFLRVERNRHKEVCVFTWNLTQVYKLMLAAGYCAMCNVYTKNSAWGVPLCGPKCAVRWKFAEESYTPLNQAILQAGKRGLLKEPAADGGKDTDAETPLATV